MNLLFNASNLTIGGGPSVVNGLLPALASLRETDMLHVAVPAGTPFEILSDIPNIKLYPAPRSCAKSLLGKWWYNHVLFHELADKVKAEKIISLGNVALNAGKRPQLLYLALPHLVYPYSPAWRSMRFSEYLRNRAMIAYITTQMQHARRIVVQTEVMKQRLVSRLGIDKEIMVLPNASTPLALDIPPLRTRPYTKTEPLRLLFLSKWYPHKNFDLLIPLGRLLRRLALPIEISLTISADESAGAKKIIDQIKENDLERFFPILGHQSKEQIDRLWQHMDGLFLPTFLESYSGAYANAAQAGRVIFTSKYDFATRLLGPDTAFYFNPEDPMSVFETLQQAVSQPGQIVQKAARAKEWSEQQPDWQEIAARFSGIIDTFA